MRNKDDVFMPDFGPPQQQPWLDMPDEQPIDFQPAASAFKQRFLAKPKGDAGGDRMYDAGPEFGEQMVKGSKAGGKSL